MGKKRRNSKNLLVLVLSLVVLISALGATLFFTQRSEKTAVASGFTTLGLSRADFRSSSPYFDGKLWILYVSQDGMAQKAEGLIEREEVEDESGTEPEKDLSLDIGYSTQTCEYPIVKDSSRYPIKKFDVITWTVNPLKGCSQAEADKRCDNYFWFGKFTQSFKCFCVEETVEYPVGYFNSPQVHTEAKIEVEAGGDEYDFDFSTRGDVKGYIGPNVYVKWDGYKGTAKPCSDKEAAYLATYYNGEWRGIYKAEYERYLNKRDSLDILLGTGVKQDYFENQISDLNSKSSQALAEADLGDIDDGSSLTSAVLVSEPDKPVEIPTYVFYVKADWLGIYQPIGKPKIRKVETECFKTGDEGIVYVEIENIGDGREGFEIDLDCPSPFREGPTVEEVIPAGNTETVRLKLYADVNQKTTKECEVTVEGIEESDSEDFTACVDPEIVCQAGSWSCEIENSLHKVYKCNEHGSANELVQVCKPSEECVYAPDGRAYCEKVTEKEKVCDDGLDNDDDTRVDCEDSDCDGKQCRLEGSELGVCKDAECVEGNPCVWYNPATWWNCFKQYIWSWVKKQVNKFLLPFKLIGALLAGLGGFIFTYDLTKQVFKKKSEKTFVYLISGLVAVLLGALVWFYLLTGLIIFIAYLLLKGVIKGLVKRLVPGVG